MVGEKLFLPGLRVLSRAGAIADDSLFKTNRSLIRRSRGTAMGDRTLRKFGSVEPNAPDIAPQTFASTWVSLLS
jgi:hypothetical protein